MSRYFSFSLSTVSPMLRRYNHSFPHHIPRAHKIPCFLFHRLLSTLQWFLWPQQEIKNVWKLFITNSFDWNKRSKQQMSVFECAVSEMQCSARAIVCLLVFGLMCTAHRIACGGQFKERERKTCALFASSVGEKYEYNYWYSIPCTGHCLHIDSRHESLWPRTQLRACNRKEEKSEWAQAETNKTKQNKLQFERAHANIQQWRQHQTQWTTIVRCCWRMKRNSIIFACARARVHTLCPRQHNTPPHSTMQCVCVFIL